MPTRYKTDVTFHAHMGRVCMMGGLWYNISVYISCQILCQLNYMTIGDVC